MEHAETLPEQPYVQRKATEEKGAEVGQLLSPEIMGRNLGPLLLLPPDGGQLSSQVLDHSAKTLNPTCSQWRSTQHGLYVRTIEGAFWITPQHQALLTQNVTLEAWGDLPWDHEEWAPQ